MIRPLVAGDLGWVVDLLARDGRHRESFAPRFWRRAPDARRIHASYLGALIGDPAAVALRTGHAFAFGLRRPGLVVVDDAAAEHAGHWATEGAALLRRLAGDSRVRLVCPVPHPERAALAARLGLSRVETWWHRDLAAQPSSVTADEPLEVDGAQGRLVPAPPIYAPGGPVLLVTEFRDRRALAELEHRAEGRGAAVSVVTRDPGGYRHTCDFYEGTLSAPSRP
jgi:hypothetical protein